MSPTRTQRIWDAAEQTTSCPTSSTLCIPAAFLASWSTSGVGEARGGSILCRWGVVDEQQKTRPQAPGQRPGLPHFSTSCWGICLSQEASNAISISTSSPRVRVFSLPMLLAHGVGRPCSLLEAGAKDASVPDTTITSAQRTPSRRVLAIIEPLLGALEIAMPMQTTRPRVQTLTWLCLCA